MSIVLWILGAYLVLWVVCMVAICLSPNAGELQ